MSSKTQIKLPHMIIIGACVFVAIMALLVASGKFGLNMSFGSQPQGTGQSNGGPYATSTTGLVSVTKPVKIPVTNFFTGSGATGQLYIYLAGADTFSENLTISSGVATTANAYSSGTVLNLKYDDGNNALYWQSLVIPKVSQGDSFGDYINLKPESSAVGYTMGTYSTDALKAGTSALSDADTYNSTLSGTLPIFKYELSNTGNDNTGLMTSSDPITGLDWNCDVVVVFSGAGAETIGINEAGFDETFTVGTTQYGIIHLDPDALSTWKDSLGAYKYKDGTKCVGTQTVQWTPDLSAYTGTAATMQVYAYMYVDWEYAEDHNGNFGSQKVQLAEQTITLTV